MAATVLALLVGVALEQQIRKMTNACFAMMLNTCFAADLLQMQQRLVAAMFPQQTLALDDVAVYWGTTTMTLLSKGIVPLAAVAVVVNDVTKNGDFFLGFGEYRCSCLSLFLDFLDLLRI